MKHAKLFLSLVAISAAVGSVNPAEKSPASPSPASPSPASPSPVPSSASPAFEMKTGKLYLDARAVRDEEIVAEKALDPSVKIKSLQRAAVVSRRNAYLGEINKG
jgi:hypothetical protein